MATTKRKPKTSLKSDPLFANFRPIEGMTDSQDDMIDSFRQGYNVVAVGSAGTGKTYVGLALALEALIEGRVNKIILIRSAVATRDIGFLPGTEAEKMAVYEQAFSSIVNELLGRGDAYQVLKQKGVIEFHSSSFLRGVTIKDAIIVVDEIANYNQHEMQTILSRVGDNARVILMGDFRQCDLNSRHDTTCLPWLMKVVNRMGDYMEVVEFTRDDICRSGFCKAFIIACEEVE